MFDKKDLSVSLVVAERKIKELENDHKVQYDALYADFTNFINKTKESIGVIGEGEFYDLKIKLTIGQDTGITNDGIKVFTGDEIRLVTRDTDLNGKLAIVSIKNEKPYWQSNYESGHFHESMEFEITQHFVHYKEGEEVAKGRKGSKGFTVHATTKSSIEG